MDKIKNVPVLRFSEFQYNWTQANIEDYFDFKNGLNKEKEYFGRGTPIINFTDVYHLANIKKNNIKGLVELNSKEIERYSARVGDVFFTRTSETIIDIGMSATLIENIDNCVFSGFVLRARPKESNFEPLFTSYCFNIGSIRKEIVTKSSLTTRALTSGTLLNKVVFNFPKNKKEQIKIAEFLSEVDKKIELLTKKKQGLENYKKGIMQKLFNQEVRFKDDNGNDYPDWKEKCLAEIGETYNGLTGKTKINFGEGNPYIQYKQVFNNLSIDEKQYGFVKIEINEKQNQVQYGDILFTTSSETPIDSGMSSVFLNHQEGVYLNSFCFGFRPNSILEVVPEFAKYLFRNDSIRRDIVKLAQGSTRYNISKVQMMKISLKLPKKEEQEVIGKFITDIENKIIGADEEISNFQKFKKGLLQQMFV